MRKCLSPFFIGQQEPGLDNSMNNFDVFLPQALPDTIEVGSISAINFINHALSAFVTETVAAGERPLTLSGDCLSAIGCLAGLANCGIQPYLLWIDAHGDFHTNETTISGHLGGMPLAMISGRGDLSLLNGVELSPLSDEQIYYVGGSDLEIGEREALESSGIRRAETIEGIFYALPTHVPLWVHFDTDYISANDVPAIRYPVPNGVSLRLTKEGLDAISTKSNIAGLSISAWAPHLDVSGKTVASCWDAISSLAAI